LRSFGQQCEEIESLAVQSYVERYGVVDLIDFAVADLVQQVPDTRIVLAARNATQRHWYARLRGRRKPLGYAGFAKRSKHEQRGYGRVRFNAGKRTAQFVREPTRDPVPVAQRHVQVGAEASRIGY